MIETEECSLLVAVLVVQAVLVSVVIVDQRPRSGAAHNALEQSPPACSCLLPHIPCSMRYVNPEGSPFLRPLCVPCLFVYLRKKEEWDVSDARCLDVWGVQRGTLM